MDKLPQKIINKTNRKGPRPKHRGIHKNKGAQRENKNVQKRYNKTTLYRILNYQNY